MKIETLRDLFMLKIMSLYDIETTITKALPKVIKAATDPELKESLITHLRETETHVERLEKIFEMLEMKPKKTKVEAIRGLVADTEWIIGEDPSADLLDALLIASARYVEHYEMAGYMTAIAWANLLDMEDAGELLEATLEEETNAESILAEAAESKINPRAKEATSEDMAADEEEM